EPEGEMNLLEFRRHRTVGVNALHDRGKARLRVTLQTLRVGLLAFGRAAHDVARPAEQKRALARARLEALVLIKHATIGGLGAADRAPGVADFTLRGAIASDALLEVLLGGGDAREARRIRERLAAPGERLECVLDTLQHAGSDARLIRPTSR